MQRLSLWLAVPVACVFACGDATQPAPFSAAPSQPVFSVTVPYGVAAHTSCTQDSGNYVIDPHFDPNYFPVTTFADTGFPSLAGQCGDLVFNNRTRSVTTIYATHADLPGESPWKYWWRRARYADNGSGALTEVRKVSVAAGTPDTAVVEMPLSDEYDAVGVVLITDSVGSRQISDQPFTSYTAGPWGDVNLKLQHWRETPPPSLTAVTPEDGVITLVWSNQRSRSIDSTNIYRNGQQLTTVAPGVTTWQQTSPGSGTWKHTLKHLSWPAALAPSQTLEFPNSDTSNAISITLGTACARRAEPTSYVNTLQQADQYLSAGCSELGTNKRFRWYTAGDVPLTSWSSDTLFDFLGHTSTGGQIVILKDSNTTTHATTKDTLAFTVSSGQIVPEGPTFITDKQQKAYVAKSAGYVYAMQWFERYDDGPQWYEATAYEQDTLKRIWPWGEYTVDLRAHKYTGVLWRGRLFIEVCSPDCGGGAAPAALQAAAGGPAGAWGLFGAGPWIGWGSPDLGRTLRLYDLWGMHDRASPFTDVGWFTGPGGTVADAETGWQVTWAPRDLEMSEVRAVDLTVTNTRSRAHVFSMAVDPDLGSRGGDDVASYDPQRDLVLVADAEGALGLLLRRGSANALTAVEEYGVGRWAPTISLDAWAAQRSAGVHLRGTPGDVQLVLSAAETSGSATWTFVVLRGTSVEAVRDRADTVLRALR
jgi:hypothetical protein